MNTPFEGFTAAPPTVAAPAANALGFQPAGRSYGGSGSNGMAQMLIKMFMGGKSQTPSQPTTNQMTAFNSGAGPVSADYANMLAKAPPTQFGLPKNDYYGIGLGTSTLQ